MRGIGATPPLNNLSLEAQTLLWGRTEACWLIAFEDEGATPLRKFSFAPNAIRWHTPPRPDSGWKAISVGATDAS